MSARRVCRPHRPSKYGYDFRNIADFPRRLLFPPNAGVGTVRSFKLKPMYDVHLEDVLEGKHLPPLTLKDFEEYLVFVEHSVENLYFICWLREYQSKYSAWQLSLAGLDNEKRPPSLPELTLSFARARATFFDPNSHLELNLPSADVQDLLTNAKPYAHPPPSVLSEVEKQVEAMLRESLMKFVSGSCGNSGRRRGLFAIIVGLVTLAVGLIPVLLSILAGRSRWIRLSSIPAFWFGAMTAIAGFHGVCVVIFLFGDARQLYPYELARPSLDAIPQLAPLSFQLPLPVTEENTRSATDVGHSSIKVSSQYNDEKSAGPVAMSTSYSKDAETLNMETAGFIPSYIIPVKSTTSSSYAGSISASSTAWSSSHASGAPAKFDFDALPSPFSPKGPKGEFSRPNSMNGGVDGMPARGMFCSLTKVLSPVVTRAQWEIVMRSAIMGVFVAVLLAGICFALPFKK